MHDDASTFTVVGIGELLWDLLPGGKQIGGAPANFAYHAGTLGAHACVVTAVGDDDAGRELLQRLIRFGVDSSFVGENADHPTGVVSVELDDSGVPHYKIHERVAWDFMTPEPEHLDLASQADAVCFGSLAQRCNVSRKTIRSFLRATRPDCLRIFDINLRQAYFDENVILQSLSLSNVLKLNESELAILGSMISIEGTAGEMIGQLAERFSLIAVALTCGERGCLIRAGEKTAHHIGFPQDEIEDTIGAGDCFAATLAVGLLRHEPLKTISTEANRRAAFVCTRPGAMPEMP